ncbi:4Fe-4S dicluster domain-containing protein [Bacteroides sp. 214]|uniref:4Fe-4S binding protein n=1 Tax=Bacteroides sp. 214 TaxID=2302935 RepID=UPI0013D007EC|nr:4Fe-4S binding protein [Bacteroides sp. 214]NDW12181.1 4Fe-4S dicluster domain-containing protein [Bacteroides sp. 214]
MLRKTRIGAALFWFTLLTLLFLDFTGGLHKWLGWLAHIQLIPAIIALHIGIIIVLILLTLLFGRVYCSVICPLGVFQDGVSWVSAQRKKKKRRFRFSPAISWLRYTLLGVFVLALIMGFNWLVAILEPYSAYGRIASTIFAPVYQWGNNLLACVAERADSYLFYSTEVWLKSGLTLAVAIATLTIISILAWRNGRTYCNTICPAGTLLGFFSRFSYFKPIIDADKCNKCGLCARNCKASCINPEDQKIDYSRCVACMNCIGTCNKNALTYARPRGKKDAKDSSRRNFLSAVGMVAVSATLKAQERKVDGGLAIIEDKKIPKRTTPIFPAGAESAKNFGQHCTACQLCVSVCPNQVLRPSEKLDRFMQPEMSYERGYCRPECTKCAEVCPTHAIHPISVAEKSSIQIGHAVWFRRNCLTTKGVKCNNCARHCPTGAIMMVPSNTKDPNSIKIPAIDTSRCIGCGACENLCPARPFSAIHVEGHERHSFI